MVDVEQALRQMGGVSSRQDLLRAAPRRAVEAALRDGTIVEELYGRYALPAADAARRAANRLTGVVSSTSVGDLDRRPSCPEGRRLRLL